RHGEPLEQRHVVNVLDINVERRRAHRIDDHDVKIAVVPADDARAVFLPEIDLPLGDHGLWPRNCACEPDISPIYHWAQAPDRPSIRPPEPGGRSSVTREPYSAAAFRVDVASACTGSRRHQGGSKS